MASPTTAHETFRIAAMADLHFPHAPQPRSLRELFSQASAECDVLVLPGDLTDRGLPEEALGLAREIHGAVNVPVIAVLGNHDYESGRAREVRQILIDAGVKVLDGEAVEIGGVGFAGVKGFCGGFGKRALGPWGEDIIKSFVHEAVEEALKLEAALARMRGLEHKVAVLHYSPIQATVEGEPCEIYPFLGSSRLEEPLSRYPVDVVFHGHAHRGAHQGSTANGVPVYNVGLSVLEHSFPDRPPFKVFEISRNREVLAGGLQRTARARDPL